MKFKFNKDASRILDYILFPGIGFFIEEHRESDDELVARVISKEYKKFAVETADLLAPYKDEISKYYNKDIYSFYDFTNIIIHGFPVYDFKSEHEYLKSLLDTEESTIKNVLIQTLFTIDDNFSEEDEIEVNESNALSLINDLKIDSSNKWNLLMMIQKPKEYLKGYVSLLEKTQSIFYNYYDSYAKEANAYGVSLANKLSENTEKTFKDITYDSITYDFNESNNCELYISTIFPYSLRFLNTEGCRIIWGMDMEKSFKIIHEIREDKLSERVKIFKALGDKTRYETLKLLASGVKSVKDIAAELDVSSATISYHINEFLTSGIVTLRVEKSKKAGYKVDYKKLEEVMSDFKTDLNFNE